MNRTTTEVKTVEIIVWNDQGASDTHRGTVAECMEWLTDTWADPENLKAEIHDEGRVIATKPMGATDWQ